MGLFFLIFLNLLSIDDILYIAHCQGAIHERLPIFAVHNDRKLILGQLVLGRYIGVFVGIIEHIFSHDHVA